MVKLWFHSRKEQAKDFFLYSSGGQCPKKQRINIAKPIAQHVHRVWIFLSPTIWKL